MYDARFSPHFCRLVGHANGIGFSFLRSLSQLQEDFFQASNFTHSLCLVSISFFISLHQQLRRIPLFSYHFPVPRGADEQF